VTEEDALKESASVDEVSVSYPYIPSVKAEQNKVVVAIEILKNESFWAVFSCGAVYYPVQGGCNIYGDNGILNCNHAHKK